MKIIKTDDGDIIRRQESCVVRRLSDGELGYLSNRCEIPSVCWGGLWESKIEILEDIRDKIEFVQIPKPEGYENIYEEFYGEGGIFWPLPGTQIKYKGTHRFWFTNIVKNAEDNLEIGKEYTIKSISPASSWCEVKVEEFPDMSLALSFFEYE